MTKHKPTPSDVNDYELRGALISAGYSNADTDGIVRAVNAHEELIEALRKIQGMTDGICHCDPLTPGLTKAERICDFCVVTETCKKAIAKAEGK